MRLATACALCASAAAHADPWIVGTLGSHHFTGDKHEQHNYGAGVELPSSRDRVAFVAGAYRNSFDRLSAYAGAAWTPLAAGPVHAGVIAAMVTGYPSGPVPAILPTLQIEGERFGGNLYYAPKLKDSCAVIGLQVKFRFW